MNQKDNWGWIIEIENIHDKTKTNIQINNDKGCVYIHSEIQKIIDIFFKIENKITIKFKGLNDGSKN